MVDNVPSKNKKSICSFRKWNREVDAPNPLVDFQTVCCMLIGNTKPIERTLSENQNCGKNNVRLLVIIIE